MVAATPVQRLSESAVHDALRDVEDPELPVSIIDLGLVYGVGVAPGRVEIAMTLTSLACPAQGMLVAAVKDRLAALPGVTDVAVRIVWSPPWSRERITEDGRDQLRGLGIAV